jgi:hypothetical protein
LCHVLKEQRYILRRPFIMNNLIGLIRLCLIGTFNLSHLELLVLCPIGTAIRCTVSNLTLLPAASYLFDLLEEGSKNSCLALCILSSIDCPILDLAKKFIILSIRSRVNW